MSDILKEVDVITEGLLSLTRPRTRRRGVMYTWQREVLPMIIESWELVRQELKRKTGTPIPMLLTCPSCGKRHIDHGAFATKPHHTHACQGCGMVWRPAKVATVGVQYLPGFKDET